MRWDVELFGLRDEAARIGRHVARIDDLVLFEVQEAGEEHCDAGGADEGDAQRVDNIAHVVGHDAGSESVAVGEGVIWILGGI